MSASRWPSKIWTMPPASSRSFSSENNTLDIQQEGQAIVGAAANLAGEMIAAAIAA